jgi:hypothetical protein
MNLNHYVCGKCGFVVSAFTRSRGWSTASEAECCAEYRRLAQMAAEKGYKPGWAKYQMKLKTGRWPRQGW